MSQFDDFNERVDRAKAEVDREIESDATHRFHRQERGELGFGWRLMEFFAAFVGELFARSFMWILGTVVLVGVVTTTIGVSFQTALFIVGVAAVAALAFAMSS